MQKLEQFAIENYLNETRAKQLIDYIDKRTPVRDAALYHALRNDFIGVMFALRNDMKAIEGLYYGLILSIPGSAWGSIAKYESWLKGNKNGQ